jgi:hypothetical protein
MFVMFINSLTRLSLAACGFILVFPGLAAAEANLLRAGVARVDITPLKPVTLSGYESRKDLSRGVHDPLFARAIAFEQAGNRLVLVSTEILGWYGGTAEPFRRAILESCRLRPSELFLSAIHTHSAPTPVLDPGKGHSNNVEYTQTLQGHLVAVVRAALDHLEPAAIGVGLGAAAVGANRREQVVDAAGRSSVVLGRNPDGPVDRDVQVLKITQTSDNVMTAVLFAYATHSTSLGPGNYLISGDVHGLAAQFVEHYVAGGAIAPGFAGASGNIDPWFRVRPGFNTTNGWIPEPVLLGTLLGEEVVRVLGDIKLAATNAPIATRLDVLSLPGKPGTNAMPGETVAPVPFVLTAARVGEVGFLGLGGEVFSELGRAIKNASPFRHTVIITHCNGAAGYLPTTAAYPEGGYEVRSSRFAPGAAEVVVQEALRLLRELRQ